MKLIYLDIDGVLNCQDAYHNGECQYVEFDIDGEKTFYQSFCSWSKMWLNKLISETNSKIVISSTWRFSGLEYMKKVWELEEMEGEIIGITPSFRGGVKDYTIPRGCEIDYHLSNTMGFHHINWDKDWQKKYMVESGVDNYVIIDDDGDMLYGQKNHFIQVLPSPRNNLGFNEEHYKIGLDMLNKTVIDLNY
jgi:hypothetical protein